MLKPDGPYDELRYSLRSLANVPHGEVWVVGGRPDWLAPTAHHVARAQRGDKFTNAGRVFTAISRLRDVSKTFYLFHDDMFVIEPVDEIPKLYRSSWPEWAALNSSGHGRDWTAATERLLAALGMPAVLSYEVHAPMVIERDVLFEFGRLAGCVEPGVFGRVQKRSAYGNWAEVGGVRVVVDPKVRRGGSLPAGPFVSTADELPGALREMFAVPSIYER